MADESNARKNHEKNVSAVGEGLSAEDVAHAVEIIRDAQPEEIYTKYSEVPFVYEVLSQSDGQEQISAIADRWAALPSNIERASRSVGRVTTKHGPSLVRAFCMFRFKPFRTSRWMSVPEGMKLDGTKDQTVVFIALSDLNLSNGFFMVLEKGQDVCLDGNAVLRFPPSGGGLGMLICLNL